MSKGRKTVLICSVIVMIAGLAYIAWYLIGRWEAHRIYDSLQSSVDIPVDPDPGQPEPPADDDPPEVNVPDTPPADGDQPDTPPEEVKPPYVSPIDFDVFWEQNKDIYAWMIVPDTDIQYPVVQHPTDDTYYLEHTIEGKARYPGSIYTESANSKDFSDFLTVVYGHNMKNGTMFGNLKKFRSKNYMDEHKKVSFYTPEGEYHYTLFAAVTYSSVHLMNAYNYDDEAGRQAFLDSIYSVRDLNSYIDRDVEVTTDSRLIVLSTCMGSDSHRLLVVGVLDEESSVPSWS